MAWNRSSRENGLRSVTTRGETRSSRPIVICSVFASVGVLVVFSVWYFMWKSPKPIQEEKVEKASRYIATNAPAQVKNTPQAPEKKYSERTREEKLAYFRNKYGNNLPDNLKPIVYYLENPPQKNFRAKPGPTAIFKHSCEREIAAAVICTPGTWILRPVEYDESFDRDFAQAMADKIEILDTDTESERELKQAVIAAKKELAARLKQGERPSTIMTETARTLYELGQYRSEIQDAVREYKNDPSKTDQDLCDYVEAANKMLEKKGLKKIAKPNLTLRHVTLKRNQLKEGKDK